MRMIEIRSRISALRSYFIIEEVIRGNGPLADERCTVGKWCGSLAYSMPVLSLSADASSIGISGPTTVMFWSGTRL